MIPNHNKWGCLPPGIHRATLKEFSDRFGASTTERRELMANFLQLLRLLERQKSHVLRVLVDGSFVTSRPSPGDMDIIIILARDFDYDTPEAIRLRSVKADLNIHLFSLSEENPGEIRRLVSFFGHDRDQRPRGLVEVIS
jgi:hypothetical protein